MWLLGWMACGSPSGPSGPDGADPIHPGPDDPAPTSDPTGSSSGIDLPTQTVPTDPCTRDAIDPGPPVPPANVETVTVAIRTGPEETDETADETLQLCLGVHCFPLGQGSSDQLDAGHVGVWMFEGQNLPRAELDSVALVTSDGEDHWGPVTMDIRLDGEPVYCASVAAASLGRDPGQSMRWDDPLGLHQDCTSVWDDRALTHGPMVMGVESSRANVWVRTDATRAVSVRLHPTAEPMEDRLAGWAYPEADRDFTAAVAVDCLEPLTEYTYEVWVDGAPQGEHTFTTAPADGVPSAFRLAFGSCAQHYEQPIFGALDAHAPDLFAFVGDSHYGNTDDLDSLRYWYRWSLDRPERAEFLNHTPSFATWDDHDYVGNDTLGTEPGRDTALRVFGEYWANPASGLPGTPGVFFATSWGDVDIIVLDDRYWRGVEGTMLGAAQHDWLVDRLTTATGTFKLLVDGSQFTFEAGDDSWDDFRAERDELFGLIADLAIPGVVLVSGDVHRAEIRSIEAPAYDLPEITSSPLAQPAHRACPEGSDELLVCVDEVDLWITLAIDTTVADPELVAIIYGLDGVELARHRWTLAELRP